MQRTEVKPQSLLKFICTIELRKSGLHPKLLAPCMVVRILPFILPENVNNITVLLRDSMSMSQVGGRAGNFVIFYKFRSVVGPACWTSAMLSRTRDEQGPSFCVNCTENTTEILRSGQEGKQFSGNWCREAHQESFTFRTWQVFKSSHRMQSYGSITNCCDTILFTPRHCLPYLWFKVHLSGCVCICWSICPNQAFLLTLRVLWFPWSQPVPQHQGLLSSNCRATGFLMF